MKSKIKVISIVLFLSVLMMLVSCQKQKAQWKGTIEEVDGVTVVKNPKKPIYSKDVLSLEEELSIGEVEGREEYMFSGIRSIAVDDRERIYILDYKEAHIKVYDEKGMYIRTIGRKGQGPGEFGLPRNLIITKKNEIMVEDTGNRALIFFTLDGEFIKSLSTAKTVMFSRATIDSHNNILGMTTRADPENPKFELVKFDSKLNIIGTIDSCPLLKPPMINPFMPVFYWRIDENDNIIYGYPEKYEFKIFNPEGKVVRKILKEFDPVVITEEEKEQRKKIYPPAVKLIFSRYYPAYRIFTIDDQGRIFVQTYEKVQSGEEYYYDIFDNEGRYISKIALWMEPRIWNKNKLYTIEENESGIQIVKRYKVNWKY